MPDLMDRIIADLVEGARRSEGFIRGGRANVEVSRENRGYESKLANHAALGAGLGGLLLPGVGAPIGAALGADKGQGLTAAGGSILGGAGGALAGGLGGGGLGALLGLLTGNPGAGAGIGATLGGAAGGLGGALYGANRGGEKQANGMFSMTSPAAGAQHAMNGGGAGVPHPAAPAARPSPPPLPAAALAKMHASSPFAAPPKMAGEFERGSKAACAAFGIKEAFVPALMAAGRALAPMAGKALGFLGKNPIGQQVAGTAASMGVQKMMTPSQPQQQPGM